MSFAVTPGNPWDVPALQEGGGSSHCSVPHLPRAGRVLAELRAAQQHVWGEVNVHRDASSMDQLLSALEQGSFLNKALEHQRLGGSEDPRQP